MLFTASGSQENKGELGAASFPLVDGPLSQSVRMIATVESL
jgi:hypothetical protein